jgi:hypothetical protein
MSDTPLTITTTQLFSRAAIGSLWARRAEFDESTRKMLDRLYNNRKKGRLQCEQDITYKMANSKAGALGFGRMYGLGPSLEKLQNECRATLCSELYHDIDIVNAQPSLLVQLAKRDLDVDMPELDTYNDNRDILINHVMETQSLSRDSAKQEIISILFGGSTKDSMLMPLKTERWDVAKQFSRLPQYTELFESKRSEKNIYGSFLAALTQTAERQAMLAMREALIAAGWSVDVLAYDGVMVRKREDAVCDEALMTTLSAAIKTATGFDLEVKEKLLVGFTDLVEHVADEDESIIDDLSACKELLRLLGDEITKQDNIIYIYNPANGMWIQDTGPLIGLSAVHRFFKELTFKRKNKDGSDRIYDFGGNTKNIRSMLSHLAELVPASNFIRDSIKKSEGFLLFADGICEVSTKTFTEGFDKSKVFTACTMRPFPHHDVCAIERVNHTLFVAPFSEVEVGNWYKNILARALAGHTVDKVFHVLLGEPNTGKSTVTSLLCKTFGGYVKTWELDNLKYKTGSTTDEAKRLSWIAPLIGARIALSNEARMDGIKLDGNLAKRLSGGDAITLRQNFKDEITTEIMTTFFAMANDMPSFSPQDAALRVRMNYATFNYSFVPKPEEDCGEWEKPADPLLKMKIESDEWKDAFTHIILDAYAAGVRLPAPDSVKAATDEALPVETDSIKDLIMGEYELTCNMDDYVPSRVLIDFLKANDITASDNMIGRKLGKLGLVRTTKTVGITKKVQKVWCGLR